MPLDQIVLLGRSGQVARALSEAAQAGQIDCVTLSRPQIDFTDIAGLNALLDETLSSTRGTSVVVNAAAYTNVDGAEADEDLARLVNADAPACIAAACRRYAAPFIHVSTDYVFDGRARAAYNEADETNPLNAYGRTKRAGEMAIMAQGSNAIILRTSWVVSAFGKNFLKTMLRLAEGRDEMRVVADQIGCPTLADDIAEAIIKVAEKQVQQPLDRPEIYHFCGAEALSWAGLAKRIFALADRPTEVSDIPTHEYPTAAERPAWSVLNCDALMRRYGVNQPNLDPGLLRAIQRLSAG